MASRSSATTKTLAVGRVANRPARAMGRGPRTSSSSSSSSRPACPGSRGRPSAVRPAGIASGTRTRALGNGHDNPGASKVLVVEGDTRVGVEVVKTFLSHSGDFKVAATVSDGDGKKKQKYRNALSALAVDVHEQKSDAVALTKPDVIVSCISSGAAEGMVHTRNRVFVDAAIESAPSSRFVFISSIGAGDSSDALPGPAKEAMKAVMMDNYYAEKYLGSHPELDYLILRCAPLNELSADSEVGAPSLTESPMAYGWITPAGIGSLVHRCLTSDKLAPRRTYSAVDANTIFVTNPFLRPLEAHESVPFDTLVF